MNSVTERRCRECKVVKPIEQFKMNRIRGRLCKACDAERALDRYRVNIEREREVGRA